MQNRIRELRKAKGMTMKQLGEVLGIAESTVSQYETGKRQPDNETLLRLGEFFDVTVGYILCAETEKAPAESGERDIKAAFFDGMGLTEDEQDDLWQDAKEYFQFKIAQRKRKDGKR